MVVMYAGRYLDGDPIEVYRPDGTVERMTRKEHREMLVNLARSYCAPGVDFVISVDGLSIRFTGDLSKFGGFFLPWIARDILRGHPPAEDA